MKLIFVCSPYRDDPAGNRLKAIEYVGYVIARGCLPVAPHLYFPQFLNDADPTDRRLGIKLGGELLKRCHALWVFGDRLTDGMREDIQKARDLDIPIRYIESDPDELPEREAGR